MMPVLHRENSIPLVSNKTVSNIQILLPPTYPATDLKCLCGTGQQLGSDTWWRPSSTQTLHEYILTDICAHTSNQTGWSAG